MSVMLCFIVRRYPKSKAGAGAGGGAGVGGARVKRSHTVPAVTDYRATYKPHPHTRPRSNKRPPPTPTDPNPPPMNFHTNQRDHFKRNPAQQRVQPIIKVHCHTHSII